MNVVSGLTFLPVAPWPLLLLLVAMSGLLIWWPAGPRERTETLTSRIRRSGLVALLLLAALRPALPGNDVRVDASSLDVYFVVDTTTSVMARDYAGGMPRLEGVRADLRGVAMQLPGARYSLLTFDVDTTTRLPLTADGEALISAADTLRAETSTFSRGSSVTVARDALRQALERGRESSPDRARVVFYLGDGEQTATTPPPPFALDPELLNGGAVLGYGTAAGGQMITSGSRESGDVVDPSTGRPARSVIDEKQLNAIANQLGVPYLHRSNDDNAASIVDAVQLKELAPIRATDTSETIGGRSELYWVALLALAALAAWELGAALAAATISTRSPRSRRTSPQRRDNEQGRASRPPSLTGKGAR